MVMALLFFFLMCSSETKGFSLWQFAFENCVRPTRETAGGRACSNEFPNSPPG